ncbi:MAG: hypothetical protein H0W64_02835 [Gammaproteobacteria bacterium]|nr:hypothetical protein [Gammaproteobacteria bacterium]
MNFNQLLNDGFAFLKLNNYAALASLQNLVKQFLQFEPTHWHLHVNSQDKHHQLIVELSNRIAESNGLLHLTREHLPILIELCGPDIDVQKVPDLRITRPLQKKDIVNWHRDTFYEGSPWQLNLWLPIFELSKGAGLLLIPGSHRLPSLNIRKNLNTQHPSDMVDDAISDIKLEQVQLITPSVGEAVLFFGCAIHRAVNISKDTRLSIDIRFRSAQISDRENEFYRPLCRGLMGTCVSDFLQND